MRKKTTIENKIRIPVICFIKFGCSKIIVSTVKCFYFQDRKQLSTTAKAKRDSGSDVNENNNESTSGQEENEEPPAKKILVAAE